MKPPCGLPVDGKAAGKAEVAADGSFTAKVGSFALSFGENEVTLVPASGKPSQSVTIKKQNYYDIANLDLKIANAAESHVGEGVSKYCPALSVGGQTVKTYNGFSVLPGDGPMPPPQRLPSILPPFLRPSDTSIRSLVLTISPTLQGLCSARPNTACWPTVRK